MHGRSEEPRFCEVISRVQNARAMYELHFKSFFSVLDHKIGYIIVLGMFSGLFCVDHLDGSHIIFKESGGSLHRESKVGKDRTKILCSFCGGNGSDEFSFSRASCGYSLSFRLVCNGSSR